ncbi:M23 family metallopeptidase [Lysobacter sp. cf310]|uniref:M23 family metallopeptidase n=1 Tax=Lysobacter sp. cf310 TaxID=1761790 RepID=UPI0008EBC214|nr:M23 family metallopeptidase [Lysobacter sp. cf310]SFK96350.1 Peptidase family M23 [Lysobacter sp. cf310]
MRAIAFAALLSFSGFLHAADPVAPLRQSFDLQVPIAPAPVRMDGASVLVYELHATNFSNEPLRLTGADVRDAGRGQALASYEGEALARRFDRLAAVQGSDALTLAPGQRGVLYVELSLPANAPPPQRLDHRLRYLVIGRDAPQTVDGGEVAVAVAPRLILGAPVRGGPWIAIHHPDWPRGHRRVLYTVDGKARIPGRHAIDWVKLDAQGRTSQGDKDLVANTYGYGADVLAVADATVVAVRDDVVETALISEHGKQTLGEATGNYVALDLGDGRYAFYEHLKTGSARVKPGQRVRRGETLAALGFTGDSTGPHLHFHVSDRNSPLGAEGVAFELHGFRVLGRYPDLSQLGKAPWTPPQASERLTRERERPAPNTVLEFVD